VIKRPTQLPILQKTLAKPVIPKPVRLAMLFEYHLALAEFYLQLGEVEKDYLQLLTKTLLLWAAVPLQFASVSLQAFGHT
jgi:hypothetical protein